VLAASLTEGHCGYCGLHHRRPKRSFAWNQLVGPVVVTLSGATSGASTAGDEELINADAVRFKNKLSIDVRRTQHGS
jgi:hypothetical protein